MKQFSKFFRILILILVFGISRLSAQYCLPTYGTGCTYGDGMSLFTLGTINTGTIACSGSPAWYHDYTALTTTMQQNSAYTITVQAGYSSTYINFYIDYNHNNTFDAGELIGQVICAASATNYNVPFTVPGTALTGNTRMRALTEWISYPSGPCTAQTYGNCCDFTVNIISAATPPTVATVAASAITNTSATLNGTVNANGSSTTVTFQYGLTVAYGSTVTAAQSPVTGNTVTNVSANITSLTPNTLYHYRVVGVNAGGTSNGSDMTFTTLATPPTVATTAASGITATAATINGTVNANNFSTTTSFDYGLTIAYGTNVPGVPLTVTGNTPTGVLANLTGLLPGNTYHYRINGVNAGGTSNGTDMTFTTPALAPAVTTQAATSVTTSSAILNGTVNANGALTNIYFDYGLTVAYGTTVNGVPATTSGNSVTAATANLTGLTINTLYHYRIRGVNSMGTTNGTDMSFTTICSPAGQAGAITGPTQACQGGNGYIYTVAPIPNATGYNWTVPVGGTIVAGGNTNSITVNYSPTAVSGYVFVYGTSICGNGGPSQLSVTLNAPAAPTLTGPASVCVNSTGNVYTTQPGMSNYVWTVSAGGTPTAGGTSTSNTITITWTTAGAKTVTVNYNNLAGCPALTPTTYNVTVNPLPVPTITGPTPACSANPTMVYTTQAGMTGYAWSLTGGTITAGSTTNTVNVNWNTPGAQTISVNYINSNGCTAPAPTVYPVTVNTSPVPTISGTNNLCVNSGYYFYTTESGMTNYNWSLSSGGTIVTGQGTYSIMVTWNVIGSQTVSVNYTNGSNCSAYAPTVFAVQVTALPSPAGPIYGSSSVCAGQMNVMYHVAPIPNTHAYVWTLPAGAIIVGDKYNDTIYVNFAANAVSGDITVYGNNLCGNGTLSPPFPVSVDPLPADAGTITGTPSVCQGESGIPYSVPAIANATGYAWVLPAGATIASGSNTNSITVDFGPNAVSGVITVYGTNACGNGTASPGFNVMVYPVPPAPVISWSTQTTLTSDAPAGNQWYFEGVAIPGATGQTYDPMTPGWYWDVVTLNGCSSDTSNHLQLWPVGINNLDQAGSFNVFPNPSEGIFTLAYSASEPQNFDITVINSFGQTLVELTDISVGGIAKKNIDLRPVPQGIYSIVIKNSRTYLIKKIIVTK